MKRELQILIGKADKHTRKESRDEYEAWWAAVRFLKREDHYISVMIGIASLRPAGDQLRLLGAGLGIVACIVLGSFLSAKYKVDLSQYLPSGGLLTLYICGIAGFAVIAYVIFRFIVGRKKAKDLTSKLLEELIRIYQRTQ